MDKKNAIRFESVLNQNTVKVYTDGSKPKQLPKTSIFPPWNTQRCVPGRSLSYFRSGKEPAFGKKMHNRSIVLLVDSQAVIKALIKCTVTSITVLNCIRNLNQ